MAVISGRGEGGRSSYGVVDQGISRQLGSARIASIEFFKPFVTIPPLRRKQQRASTHEAMALMSSGTIQKWGTLAADWPDVQNTISHVSDESLSMRAVLVSFLEEEVAADRDAL